MLAEGRDAPHMLDDMICTLCGLKCQEERSNFMKLRRATMDRSWIV